MNLPFLKLELAGSPWVLFDRASGDVSPESAEPDWASVAASVCGRVRGASADGVIVASRGPAGVTLATWSKAGSPCAPPPTAALCASRWLFDLGLAGPELIEARGPSGTDEVLVLDSRNFGFPLGKPTLSVQPGAKGQSRDPSLTGGGAPFSVSLSGATVSVVLHDRAPERRGGGRRGKAGEVVDVLVAARHELRLKGGQTDPVLAAGAAAAAAALAGYCDREVSVLAGGERLAVQWPERESLFVAGAPLYCLSGEYWIDD